jgi:DNA polymerase-3 subunit alpha/error-prone DNA polymerase
MDFISFEDESALYETILFPQLHEKYRKLLYSQRPLLIRGTVSDDMGALYVEINAISPIMF